MRDLLRALWDEPRPPQPPRRVWRDWLLVAVLVPAAVLEAALQPQLPYRFLWMAVVVGLVPTLLWRRTRPLAMVAVAFVGCGLAPLFTGGVTPEYNSLAYIGLLPYALARWGAGREIVLGAVIMIGKVAIGTALGQMTPSDLALALAVLSAVTAAGIALRYRARARARELEQAKLLERERLARDLHDTVAHHVSAMAIRAQAGLATAATDPDAAVAALRLIEAEASGALAEMRAMVRVLRRDQPAELEPGPSPRVADLERLAGRSRGGPPVAVELSGDLDGVPPPVGAAVYRLVQESVTNARRHARHATRIEVRVDVDDAAVRLRVSDDGEPAGARPAGSAGYGLIGMIERADLLGGSCSAGPNPGRGWTVTATLPRAGATA